MFAQELRRDYGSLIDEHINPTCAAISQHMCFVVFELARKRLLLNGFVLDDVTACVIHMIRDSIVLLATGTPNTTCVLRISGELRTRRFADLSHTYRPGTATARYH